MQHRVVGQPGESASGLQRDAALPVPRRRVDEHMQVVGRIRQGALTFRGFLIGLPGLKARGDGVAPPPHFRPDVRRHVIDVARARDGIAKALSARDGPLGLRGSAPSCVCRDDRRPDAWGRASRRLRASASTSETVGASTGKLRGRGSMRNIASA